MCKVSLEGDDHLLLVLNGSEVHNRRCRLSPRAALRAKNDHPVIVVDAIRLKEQVFDSVTGIRVGMIFVVLSSKFIQ